MKNGFILKAKKLATIPIIAFVFSIAGVSQAAASDGNAFLLLFVDSDHLIKTCGKENQSVFSEKKIQTFENNFKVIEKLLVTLTQDLHPYLSAEEAAEKVKTHIFNVKSGFLIHFGKQPCEGPKYEKRVIAFEAHVSDLFKHVPKKIYPPKYKYDTQIPGLKSSNGTKTFAQPSFQKKILDTIGAAHFKDGSCTTPDVISVSLLSKDVQKTRGLPPYILPPILYAERWIVVCNETEANYDVKFMQDSEGPRGNYSVSGPK